MCKAIRGNTTINCKVPKIQNTPQILPTDRHRDTLSHTHMCISADMCASHTQMKDMYPHTSSSTHKDKHCLGIKTPSYKSVRIIYLYASKQTQAQRYVPRDIVTQPRHIHRHKELYKHTHIPIHLGAYSHGQTDI